MRRLDIKDYQTFLYEFSFAIRSADCFYGYGSFFNGSFIPGRSDLDGGIVFDCEFVIPKDVVHILALNLEDSLSRIHQGVNPSERIKTQFNLTDRATNKDGRFLSYDDTYTDLLKSEGVILKSPNFLNEMNGMNYRRESLRAAAYNLREVRNGLLTYFVDLKDNPPKAKKNIYSSISNLWSMQKKLIELSQRGIVSKEDDVYNIFREIFPKYESEMLDKARQMRRNPEEYSRIFNDVGSAFTMYQEFVTAAEKMIQIYLETNPLVSNFEVRN